MIRQETLTSKQDDLTRCITSRELKLRELYHATVNFLNFARAQNQGLNNAKYLEDGEASFLEANSISEGRSFDPATLPSLHGTNFSHGLPYIKARSPHNSRPSVGQSRAAKDPEQSFSEPLTGRNHDKSQAPEKPKEQSPVTSLVRREKTPSQTGDAESTRTSTAEESSLHDVNGEGSQVQLKLNKDDPNDTANRPLSEPYQIDETSLANSLVPDLELEKNSGISATKPDVHPAETLPLTGGDATSTPEADSSSPGPTPQIPVDLQSNHLSSREAENPRLDDRTHARYKDGKEQAAELPVPRSNIPHKPYEKAVEAEKSDTLYSATAEEQGKEGARNDSKSNHGEFSKVHSLSQEAPKHLSVVLQSNGDEDAIRNDTDPRIQPGRPGLESAFAGTPSTPDEQLRLEEAQSMQQFKLPSNGTSNQSKVQNHPGPKAVQTTISSQFVHGGLDEGANTATHTSTSEIDSEHHGSSSKGFSGHDGPPIKPTVGLRDGAFPGMVGDLSKDLTLSRRPPMRIDTGVPPTSEIQKSLPIKKTATPSAANSYTPLTSTTNRSSSLAVQAQSPPERMTTRVSSGAIRHKSVSEILGETPKPGSHIGDKSPHGGHNDSHREETSIQTPRSASMNASPDPATFKLRLNELKGKERSKLSTVVFARQQPSNSARYLDSSQSQRTDTNEAHLQHNDYFQSMFQMQAATPPTSLPLHALIASAHKALSTSNHYTHFHETKDCRMLERIFQLQSASRWSLRQLERTVEPDRPVSHWDVLINQMKWMRVDFREERKWKITAAKSIADSCADWCRSSAKGRMALQIKTRPLPARVEAKTPSVPTPELIPSAEDDSSVATDFDSPRLELPQGSAPAAIFSLAPEIFYFGVDKTPVTEKLLLELPLYQPSIDHEDAALRIKSIAPDAAWKTPLVPLSKFVHGKIISQDQGPPRKKSRFNYEDLENSRWDYLNRLFLPSEPFRDVVEPEQEDVALFNPENKHIRDRIHAGHAFRPPSEHIMPSQSFFECRQSSQWTQAEDDELRRLVREYAYNWSLVSSCLSSPSIFSSGAERRTPWECFERWIGLEGLPAEMSKTQYFKAYHSRLQAAQKTHEAQQQAMQQNQGNNAPHLPMRRRTTQPYLVDRRKNNKYLHIVDAMRKLAKKREAALHKQQHVASLAAMRKSNEAAQPRRAMHTPQEFSRLKYERECKMADSAKAFRQSVFQQQRAQKANQPSVQQMQGSNGMQPGRIPIPGSSSGSSPSINALQNGQIQSSQVNPSRPMPPMPRLVNGSQTPNGALPANIQGIPHAPMQGPLPMQQRLPPQMGSDNLRVYHEANRVQAEQQRYLLQQRQQQHPQPNGQPGNSASPNMGHLNLMSQNNSAILASLQGRSGSPSVNNVSAPTGSSSSPQMTNPTQPQRLSSGVVPAVNQIQMSLKNRNPQASPEQISKMTTETLDHYRVNHPTLSAAAAAMHAAAGPNMTALPGNLNMNLLSPPLQQQQQQQQQQQSLLNSVGSGPMLNPQQHYAHLLRTQQQSQQSRSNSSINGARTASRSATPQTHRSGSAQGGAPPSQSPRPSQAQIAGGQ